MIARVYAAISAVTAALAGSGIAKARFNLDEGYAYRSIDDVVIRLAPLLVEHKLCVLPRVLERTTAEREGLAGEALVSVSLTVAYDIVSAEDGSTHTIEVVGEALDTGDKGTAKALQSAYKYAMIQAFAIPVTGSEEADSRSPRLRAQLRPTGPLPIEPVQGWDQWASDVAEMIAACESSESITWVQETYRPQLTALQRERPQLYASLGEAIGQRRVVLAQSARERARAETPDLVQSARDRCACEAPEVVQSARDEGAPSGNNLVQSAQLQGGSKISDLAQTAQDEPDLGTADPAQSASVSEPAAVDATTNRSPTAPRKRLTVTERANA